MTQLRGLFITLGVYLLLILLQQMVYAAETGSANSYSAHKPNRNRILTRFARPQNQYNKAKPEMFNDFFGKKWHLVTVEIRDTRYDKRLFKITCSRLS